MAIIIILLLEAISFFAQNITTSEQVIYSNEIYFDFGKDLIRQEADSVLNALLLFCESEKPPFFIKITAHTDAVGNNKQNMMLSQRRGAVVQTYLEDKNINTDSLFVSVFGENQPAASNDTDNGRQQNRRATLEVIKIKKYIPLIGSIIDKKSGEGIKADILVRSKDTNDTLKTDAKGHFESKVPLGEVIGIDVWAKGYFLETKMMRVSPESVAGLVLKLPPLEKGETVDIDNLYFVGNQAVLLKKSLPELPKVLKFMEINLNIKIEIAGHINRPKAPPVTKDSWDYNLSLRRAKFVYNYLIENGIAENRLTYKGYGNWEMRYPQATSLQHQAANRRVEIRVLEIGN